MRLRFSQVLLALLAALGLGVAVLTVAIMESGVQRELRDLYRTRISSELERVAELVRRSEGAGPAELAATVKGSQEDRVTIIDTAGVVVADSDIPSERLAQVENHRERPEVIGAMAGAARVGFDVRPSTTLAGREFLYVATRSELGGEPVIVRVAVPLEGIDRVAASLRNAVVWACLSAVVLMIVPVVLLGRVFSTPLAHWTDRLKRLAEREGLAERSAAPAAVRDGGGPTGLAGADGATARSWITEIDRLGSAFDRLALQFKARIARLDRDRRDAEALVENAAEGVVALAADGRIVRSNRMARTLLGIPEEGTAESGGTFGGVVRHPELRAAVSGFLGRGRDASANLAAGTDTDKPPDSNRDSIEFKTNGTTIAVSARAVPEGGAILTLMDISEIRRVEKVRRDFVANASHELRTPITAITGLIETLVEDDLPAEQRAEFLTYIQENTHRLRRLVEDLLDLSRLEGGGWVAANEPVDVLGAANEAWTLIGPQWAAKRVTCTFSGEATASGDPAALVNVFRNLLENSARHVDEAGRIAVSVEGGAGGAGQLVVEVTDDGEGIPADVIGRVFERFFRADSSRTRDRGGTGLGLAIVRHIIRAMGGTVRAQSELGQGTTIRFTLPAWEGGIP